MEGEREKSSSVAQGVVAGKNGKISRGRTLFRENAQPVKPVDRQRVL